MLLKLLLLKTPSIALKEHTNYLYLLLTYKVFMLKRIGLILLFFYCIILNAQGEANIWYFGNDAGIDFSSGSPVALTDGDIFAWEGCSTISSASGDLLFYTNGVDVRNRNHEIMVNGTGLFGSHVSSSQSAVIVPKPNDNNIYYIFTTDSEAGTKGLNYSEIDMTLDSGLGAVLNKNILLYTPTLEKLSAVKHANGEDIWLVAHEYGNNNFTSFLVTSNGVNSNPIISSVGPIIGTADQTSVIGCIKFSPNGQYLAMCSILAEDGSQIYDFDSSTGVLSNPINISNREEDYGLEFSPSSEVLYITNFSGFLYQYDLNPNNIAGTEVIVYNFPDDDYSGQLQLGPDHKIYHSIKAQGSLNVIDSPNTIGLGCNYIENAVPLNGGIPYYGLPSFMQSYFNAEFQFNNSCFGETTEFNVGGHLIGYDMIAWDFGDGTTSLLENPSHLYMLPGDYTVELTLTYGLDSVTDTKAITINEQPIAYQPDNMNMCVDNNNGVFNFDLTNQNNSILNGQSDLDFDITYHLSQSDADNNIDAINTNFTNVENPQTIFVRIESIENPACYDTTVFNIEVFEQQVLTMTNQWFICEGESLELIADAGFDNYLWSTGETTSSINIETPGSYSITASNNYNGFLCETTQLLTVSVLENTIDASNVFWNQYDNSITITVDAIGDFEYSIDGVNFQSSNQFSNLLLNDYNVYIRDTEGCNSISIEVYLVYFKKYFTPNGDGINDTWQVFNSYKEPNMLIYIYNRFGMLITKVNPLSTGWNGTFNGAKLPTSDYWYIVIKENGKKHSGHFTLKR